MLKINIIISGLLSIYIYIIYYISSVSKQYVIEIAH